MNILVVNDDGINAKGIKVLAKKLAKTHNVYMIAPAKPYSGASHAVSFFTGVSYKSLGTYYGIPKYAVYGYPSDCVMLGLKVILKDIKIDCVVSGINDVVNIGSDVMYSGTFNAAAEATYQNVPGIAISLRTRRSQNFDIAADFIYDNLEKLISYTSRLVTINVNIPSVNKEEILGVKVAKSQLREYAESYVCEKDKKGRDIYYVNGHRIKQTEDNNDGDCYFSEHGYITITPIQMLNTDFETLKRMEDEKFIL